MIRCGISTPQTVTLTGTLFVAGAKVLVTPPDSDVTITVTPLTISATVITFEFVFAICGDYTIQVTDETGTCDNCASLPFTLTTVPVPCPTVDREITLGELLTDTQHRLGDDDGAIWPTEEVRGNLVDGYKILATQLAVFWDLVYAENLPRGFSYTQPWERAYLPDSGGFDYGVGNFTAEFERRAGTSLGFDERKRYGPANHTSPFEATDGLLSRAGASTAIPATAELPKSLTKLDRVIWDNRWIEPLEPRSYSRQDSRYEITAGEVLGYMWQKDGVRTLRKIRVPSAQADTATIDGSWGLLRDPTDLSADTVTGTWGIARRIPGHHPMTDLFGVPRRPYLEGKNVRVEHFRQGRPLIADNIICELPYRYALYLRDYAMSACLERPGPGYDADLAKHYDGRWQRGLTRIARRIVLVDMERRVVIGGSGQPNTRRPPHPRLPAAYGSYVR